MTKKIKTQKQLADEIGVSRRALADWKRQGTDLSNPKAIANQICQSRTPPPKAL
jgi:DNA-binding XRE family transcriptional regulator